VALVAAQPGDRDEDLRGVGQHTRPTGGDQPCVPHLGGRGAEPPEVLPGRGQERGRLVEVERRAALGASQGTADLLGVGQLWHLPQSVTDHRQN
jgi:hypothetical protein